MITTGSFRPGFVPDAIPRAYPEMSPYDHSAAPHGGVQPDGVGLGVHMLTDELEPFGNPVGA